MSRLDLSVFEDVRLPPDDSIPIIMVMGATGAGKSYFINQLVDKSLATVATEGSSLDSCTQNCTLIPVHIGATAALIIDTPGFDDNSRSDSEILDEIAKVVTVQSGLGFDLKGIIYIHRITDIRYPGSAIKTLEIFKRICGDEALSNVILATSRWGEVDEITGAQRECELRQKFWSYMLNKGSTMARYYGDRESARAIAAQMIIKPSVLFKLQDEIVNKDKTLDQTAAGSLLIDEMSRLEIDQEKELQELETSRRQCSKKDKKLRQLTSKVAQLQQQLDSAKRQQASLRKNIKNDVTEKVKTVKGGENKWLRRTKKLKPFIGPAINVLLAFIGLPPCFGLSASGLVEFFQT
ncbi:P-loop containing nucleoside triphosphate hydrolase protein [Xylariaceae sp. FL0255]|nr:P-loop containing nucleoside triphosphate hydrolase protein [Xylariaceae sp. FL0255]